LRAGSRRFGRRIPETHATAGAIESLEDVVAMHPDLLQPVAIEKANPHRYGYGSGRFSTYSPFHSIVRFIWSESLSPIPSPNDSRNRRYIRDSFRDFKFSARAVFCHLRLHDLDAVWRLCCAYLDGYGRLSHIPVAPALRFPRRKSCYAQDIWRSAARGLAFPHAGFWL
jgi:hypothetical protein